MINNIYILWLRKSKYFRLKHFFIHLAKENLLITRSLRKLNSLNKEQIRAIYVWGKGNHPEIENYAYSKRIPLFRIEDGFIRSVGLGSDLTKPYSLVIDSRGIYFDPTYESDLEFILNTYNFDELLLKRARKVAEIIINSKLSKYNHQKHCNLNIDRAQFSKVILLPGQVEDDASIIYGGYGMTNEKLITEVREKNPDAFIIFKPHPDVIAGNRKGRVSNDILKSCCSMIVNNISIDSCIAISDEVHTISSLCGFEAILRNKKVVTYGLPFYSGWGLTQDKHRCLRRCRELSKWELIAGTLLLYPKYINPADNTLCGIEIVLNAIADEKERYGNSLNYRLKAGLKRLLVRKLKINYRKRRKFNLL